MRRARRLGIAALVGFVLLLGVAVAQQHPAKTPPSKTEPATPAKTEAAPAAQEQGTKGREAAEKAAGQESPGQQLTEASEEAAGEHEENAEFKQSPSVRFLSRITGLSLHAAYWLAIAINFVVIAGAVTWFMRSSLPGMFRSRTLSIRKTLDEAQRASADATRRLSDIEGRLAKLDNEIATLRAQAEAEAAEEEKRIKATADEEAHKIIESAGQEIEAAGRLAQRELKAYAADLAVSLAEKRIQVDPTTDRALVSTFVGQLGDSNNGQGGR